jgi:hypothetical protein
MLDNLPTEIETSFCALSVSRFHIDLCPKTHQAKELHDLLQIRSDILVLQDDNIGILRLKSSVVGLISRGIAFLGLAWVLDDVALPVCCQSG